MGLSLTQHLLFSQSTAFTAHIWSVESFPSKSSPLTAGKTELPGGGGKESPARETSPAAREALASAMRREHRRSKQASTSSSAGIPSGRVPLVMTFLPCLAWLYVAGLLWQDAQTRAILSGLLERNSGNLPKVLSVEDKLRSLGVQMSCPFGRISGVAMCLTVCGLVAWLEERLGSRLLRRRWT